MGKRIEYKTGDEIFPQSRFVFVKDVPIVKKDTDSNKYRRRVIVRDKETLEEFEATLSDLRTGHIKYPPSLSKQKRGENRRTWKQGEVREIEHNRIVLLKNDGWKIETNGAKTRKYIFRNLDTNIEFSDCVSHVMGGYNLGIKRSKGERYIRDCLNQMNISFYQEYIFEDCINPKTGAKLKFDFYLPEYNCCIEYDGEQHYFGWRKSRKVSSTLANVQYRDSIKTQYCQSKNIKLIRIPYTDLKKIDIKYLQTKIQKS